MIDTIFKNILFLGAHPDDEKNCAGLLARILNSKAQMNFALFSSCRESVPTQYNIESEYKEAIQCLAGSDGKYKTFVYDFPVRYFPQSRQSILEEMVILKKTINPDLVILPASTDIHQDHRVIHEEGVRAFKYSNLLGFECIQNNMVGFPHTLFFKITKDELDCKLKAMSQYNSQRNRPYMDEKITYSLATIRGLQAGCKYAEAFEVIRMIF